MEISGDVTDAGRTNERTREDRATQPMDAGCLSFAIVIFQGLRLIVFASSDNLSAENYKLSAESGLQRLSLLGCM